MSILGLVPYAGDAVAIPGKAARFVIRYIHRLEPVVLLVATYDDIPDSIKEAALELVLGEDWTAIQDAGTVQAAGDSGILAVRASMLRLGKGTRTSFARLRAGYQNPLHVTGPRVRYQFNWREGENTIFGLLSGIRHRDLKVFTPQVPTPRSVSRKPDIAVEDPPGELTLHEVKTGVPGYGGEVAQCEKAAWMTRQPNGVEVEDANHHRTRYKVRAVHWHFMPHNSFDSIGPSQELLDCLIRNSIPYTLHFPI